MQDLNVVVVFYSRTGLTENLALAAAVGAVEGKANIRLRRIPETASDETIATIPGWRENHDRMSWEYIAPREADAVWAEGIVIAVPEWMSLSAPEVRKCLALPGGGKIAAALGPTGLGEALEATGLTVLPAPLAADPIERATLQGVRVAEAARAARPK